MKTLLRSVFIYNSSDNKDLFLKNFNALKDQKLDWDNPEDENIFSFIQDFVFSHSHIPQFSTIRDAFEIKKDSSVVERLDILCLAQPKTGGDFLLHLETRINERKTRLWNETLKEALTITNIGLEIKEGHQKKHLLGSTDSATFIFDKLHDILTPPLGVKLSGEVLGDTVSFKEEYDKRKSDPLSGIGQYTGLYQMDTSLGGAKKKELWLHAAFTGGLKSTFALNWLYNQAVWFQQNSVIFSLEMPYEQCRNIIYCMHTLHPKFKHIRLALGIQTSANADVGLDYNKVKYSRLSPPEEQFLFEYVVPDFDNPVNNYGKIHIEVADPQKNDFTIVDVRHRAEVIYSKTPFSFLVVDHAGLLSPRKKYASTTDSLNEVLRDCKKLAMSFHGGLGMAVLVLFQINREGWKSAVKKKEKSGVAGYDLTHLSYANEAERSSDIVTATWIDDELREKNRVQFQCLKTRDQAAFDTFFARVEWPCRRLLTCYDNPMSSGGGTPTNQNTSSKGGMKNSTTKQDTDNLGELL
jgi:hypothetical protein